MWNDRTIYVIEMNGLLGLFQRLGSEGWLK